MLRRRLLYRAGFSCTASAGREYHADRDIVAFDCERDDTRACRSCCTTSPNPSLIDKHRNSIGVDTFTQREVAPEINRLGVIK